MSVNWRETCIAFDFHFSVTSLHLIICLSQLWRSFEVLIEGEGGTKGAFHFVTTYWFVQSKYMNCAIPRLFEVIAPQNLQNSFSCPILKKFKGLVHHLSCKFRLVTDLSAWAVLTTRIPAITLFLCHHVSQSHFADLAVMNPPVADSLKVLVK